jgi:DNA-binding PadR family transcriptional regulator
MSAGALPSPHPVLLGFLMPDPKHPYELHQEFERELGRVWHIGQSHLYAYLKQLAESGLATVNTEAQPSRPARHVYCITLAGQEYFTNWVHQPTRHVRHIRLEFLARLYFFRRLSLSGVEQLVADQKALLQVMVESLRGAVAETEDRYWRLVLEYRRGEMEAVIRWLDRCLEIL